MNEVRVFLAGKKLFTCAKKERLWEFLHASCAKAHVRLHFPWSELLSKPWNLI
jgi:hypothetical protein